MTQVNVRIPEELLEKIDKKVEENGFSTRSEYFRYLARRDLEQK